MSIGDLLSLVTSDVGTVGQALRDSVPEVLAGAVHLVVVFVATFLLDPVLGLVALAGMPFVVWVLRWYLARARDAYLAESEANGDVAEISAAVGEGSRTIETYCLGDRMVAAADATIARSYRARLCTLRLRNVLFPVTSFVNAMPTVLVLLVGGFAYTADVYGSRGSVRRSNRCLRSRCRTATASRFAACVTPMWTDMRCCTVWISWCSREKDSRSSACPVRASRRWAG